MSPYFTHPLVLALWSVAIGTMAIFGMLTSSNVLTYRGLRQPELKIYTWFTSCGMLHAACVALSLLPMAPVAKSHIFRAMWIFGPAGLGFWLWSVVTFAGLRGRTFAWLRVAFFGVAAIATLDLLATLTTGSSAFYAMEPQTTESVVLLASGNVLRHRPLADILAVALVLSALTTSVVLLRALVVSTLVDRTLLLGVVVTPILFCTEIGMVLSKSRYNLPVLFLANLIEAVRISWASRDRLHHELNDIRAAQREQAAMLESQLQQLELSTRLAKVGERTAQLSHDMRNPLTTVVGALDLAEQALRATPPDVGDARELLAGTRLALDHVLELVRRITRQATQVGSSAKGAVSVSKVVENAIALCQPRLEHVSVTVHVDDGLWASGWSTELTQVVVNLLVNACDALQGYSRPWIRVEAAAAGDMLALRVADAGRRPPEAIVDKMFVTRFTTGATSASTGLGLTICAQIVRQHQGAIFVDRRSANTTIVLELPRVREPAQDAA